MVLLGVDGVEEGDAAEAAEREEKRSASWVSVWWRCEWLGLL